MEGAAHDAVPCFNNQEGGYPDNLGLLIFKAHHLAAAVLTHGFAMNVLTGRKTIILWC
jgi:hypothetical protein